MEKIYQVTLTEGEVAEVASILDRGKHSAQKRKRAQALLLAHQGQNDFQIAQASGLTRNAIQLIRHRFVEFGFATVLEGLPKKPRPRVIDGAAEAHLVALACSEKPAGHNRWTLRLLADKLMALDQVEHVSHEAIRQVLKKRNQALAAERVVHSAQRKRRIRGVDGGRA